MPLAIGFGLTMCPLRYPFCSSNQRLPCCGNTDPLFDRELRRMDPASTHPPRKAHQARQVHRQRRRGLGGIAEGGHSEASHHSDPGMFLCPEDVCSKLIAAVPLSRQMACQACNPASHPRPNPSTRCPKSSAEPFRTRSRSVPLHWLSLGYVLEPFPPILPRPSPAHISPSPNNAYQNTGHAQPITSWKTANLTWG